jgi:hypothetical protein
VIFHASAGLMPEGPEADYVAALNAAGIATLVIDVDTAASLPAPQRLAVTAAETGDAGRSATRCPTRSAAVLTTAISRGAFR